MIELRNKQYATVLDNVVAGTDLEVGQVVKLIADAAGTGFKAVDADNAADQTVWGTLIAHWINPRSEAVEFSGGEDGLSFPLAGASDPDANHYIPSGSRMLAIGGKGATEVRYFKSSLDDDFASTLPLVGDLLGVSSTSSKLCDDGAGDVITGFTAAARVVAADEVSVSVILG